MPIDDFSPLHSPTRSLVSVYLDRPPRPSAAAISDLLKPLRTALDRFDRTTGLSIRSDLDRISALDARIDADPSPAFAVFASSADGIFTFRPLDHPVWDHASVGSRPYLRPLRAQPPPLRAGVVVAARRHASAFLWNGGGLDPLGESVSDEPRKGNFAGFRGYEEHRVRHHAGEEARRLVSEAAARLFEAHQQRPLDFLAVGGPQERVEELTSRLHPYLRQLPIVSFPVDGHSVRPSMLCARTGEEAEALRRAGEHELVASTLESVAQGARSAVGTVPTLSAVSARAVDRLVVAGTFAKPGVVCRGCGWMGRTGEECPACGGLPEEVDDVVAEAMESVVAAGGAVHQVSVASPLDAHGVAALLRFPLP